MNKQSAVIDKSLFHELCKHPHEKEREQLWHELHRKYQLVVPLILIEETLVNAIAPGKKLPDEVERLLDQVALHHTCWLDDIDEIVFRELVMRAPLTNLPPLADPVTTEIFRLRLDDDVLKRWVEERKRNARLTHDQWKAQQGRLSISTTRTELTNESEMFDVVRYAFRHGLLEEGRRKEMLEHIVGAKLRQRHADVDESIDRAFAEFTPQTCTNYRMTLARLLTRLAYVLAPTFTLPGPSPHMKHRFLKQEPNNVYDAEYVTAALICNRFLTRDEKQARMCRVFQLGGFWDGKVVYISPEQDICVALRSALI